MASTTKKCKEIGQSEKVPNSFKFLFKKWSIWRLFSLRVVRKHSKRFRDLAAGPRSEIGRSGKVPNSFTLSIEKVIDLETFGLPSGPKAFEAISGPLVGTYMLMIWNLLDLRMVRKHAQASWTLKPQKNNRKTAKYCYVSINVCVSLGFSIRLSEILLFH